MTNNKFKIRDRVKDQEFGNIGEVIGISEEGLYAVQFDKTRTLLHESELTLIDSTPEETSNVSDDSVKLNQDYYKIAEAIAGEGYTVVGYTVVEDMDYINETTKFNTILKPIKGFNPDKLEFDGAEEKTGWFQGKYYFNNVEIKQGDQVSFYPIIKPDKITVVKNSAGDCLCVPFVLQVQSDTELDYKKVLIPIEFLTITKHIPAKSELEEVREEKQLIMDKISNGDFYPGETKNILDKYAQLKERYKQLTNK